MEIKENVCENGKAEQVAEAKEVKKEKGSTAFGKFKDANALLEAYESLEAEFTRRSQRLKELERKTDNSLQESSADGGKGAEKLQQNAEKRKVRERAFDSFVAELEGEGRTLSGESVEEKEQAEERATGITATGNGGFVENQNQVSRSVEEKAEELYLAASSNEGVRLRIVGDYLASIGGVAAPVTKSGGGVLVSPLRKAKSIHEAGGMALRFFEKGGKNA
jgi:hypothetical protein